MRIGATLAILALFQLRGFSQVIANPLGGLVDGLVQAHRLKSEIQTNQALQNILNAQAEAVRAETERLRQEDKLRRQQQGEIISDRELTAAIDSVTQRYPDFERYRREAARLMPEMSSTPATFNLPHYLEGMYLVAKYASFSAMAQAPKESPAVALTRDPEFHCLPVATRIRFAKAVEPGLSAYRDEDLGIIMTAIATKVLGKGATPAPEK